MSIQRFDCARAAFKTEGVVHKDTPAFQANASSSLMIKHGLKMLVEDPLPVTVTETNGTHADPV